MAASMRALQHCPFTSASAFIFQMIRRTKYNGSIRLSSFSVSDLFNDTATDISTKSTTSVWQPCHVMIAARRREAANSILLHTASQVDALTVAAVCQSYGDVINVFPFGSDKKFALVEFRRRTSVDKLLSDSRFIRDVCCIPLRSRILYLQTIKVASRTAHQTTIHQWKERTFDIQQLKLCSNVSDQMQHYKDQWAMDELDTRSRYFICSLIEDMLASLFPESQILPFGSTINTFGNRKSDLDMVLLMRGDAKNDSNNNLQYVTKKVDDGRRFCQHTLHFIADMLGCFAPFCENVQRILHARIPIVHFQHRAFNIECDLSFTNDSASNMAQLLYFFGHIDRRVGLLVLAVRDWASSMNLIRSPSTFDRLTMLTNFMLTMMVTFFLQMREIPILPSLRSLSESEDIGFQFSCLNDPKHLAPNGNMETPEQLLREFLHFYISFDFKKKALSIMEGTHFAKPDNCAIYIEDPLTAGHNITQNILPNELLRLTHAMEDAVSQLETSQSGSAAWGLMKLVQSEYKHTYTDKPKATGMNIGINLSEILSDEEIRSDSNPDNHNSNCDNSESVQSNIEVKNTF